MQRHLFCIAAVLPLLAGLAAAAEPGFVPLFDGKTLNGWHECAGTAKFAVEDGVIVGSTTPGSPNSFLCTDKDYGDFVLELELMVDPVLNSGVNIRSHLHEKEAVVRTVDNGKVVDRKWAAGRAYGLQVEVDAPKTGKAGGIYDEARRGWIYSTTKDPVASKALKDGEWNLYRIEAVGDNIKTWVNGVPCSNVVDSEDLTGFIGLQVHSFRGPTARARFRNIRIKDLGRHVWKPLWDGKTLNGWSKKGDGVWTIENGAIRAVSTLGGKTGFLVSDRSFEDVTARVKFKIAKGNSGFFLRADKDSMAAYEVEIDEAKRTGGIWEAGGRRWMTGPEDNAGVVKDGWNILTASMHGHRVVLHLNGSKTVELPDDAQGRLSGRIALQVHSVRDTDIQFKDIEVLEPAGK